MTKKNTTLIVFLLFSSLIIAQSKVTYGIKGGLLINSAILPDLKINTSISKILQGDDVVKGKAQYADATLNYQFGGFVTYNDGFGFSMFETNYTTTRIYKEIHFKNIITTSILDRKFSYIDFALSYNIFLNKNKTAFFLLGGGHHFYCLIQEMKILNN